VKKKQLLLIGGAVLLFAILLYMGSTVAPKTPATAATAQNSTDNQHIKFEELLLKAKEKIRPEQVLRLNSIENSVVRGDVNDQKIHV
jgi:tRNA A37 N6-isopentenylltransferase MiaA